MEFANPFLHKLEDCKSILLCGCGGGFDFTHAFPLFLYLRSKHKRVVYGNLSFVTPNGEGMSKAKKYTKNCWEISANTPQCTMHQTYFPEKYMCQFIDEEMVLICGEKSKMVENTENKNQKMFIWPRNVNVKDLHNIYTKLVKDHECDAIVLVDGGSDSLQRGDEITLADVEEDSTSIAACEMVKEIKDDKKLVCFIGFGIDNYNGVIGCHILQNISNLITKGGFLGTFSLLKQMKEYELYKKAVDYIQEKCKFESVVTHSIVDATDGKFGNFHSTSRTRNSMLFINPLMSIYFCFNAKIVAQENYFIQEYHNTKKKKNHDLGTYLWKYREKANEKDLIRLKRNFPH